MQINAAQSSSVSPYGANTTPLISSTTSSSDQDSQTSSASVESVSSQDTTRLKQMVQDLMSQSDIRPDVVASRSANDAPVTPTDSQLASFIRSLRTEV